MRSLQVEGGLELRPVSEEYADDLYDAVISNFDHLHEWMPWARKGYSMNDTLAFVSRSVMQFASQETMNLIIFEGEEIAGGIGLNVIDKANKSTEIGYWLTKAATGKGIATRAVHRLAVYAFSELGMHRIMIRVAEGNLKSMAIPKRLGFRLEGIQREAEWLRGRFVDLVVYSMLEGELDHGQGDRIEC